MSDVESLLKRQINETLALLTQSQSEIAYLKEQLAEVQNLKGSAKLRFMLEKLEQVGKPAGISDPVWTYKTSRAKKWDYFINNPDCHPWINSFLAYIGADAKDVVRILFDILDGQVHNFFTLDEADQSIFFSGKIRGAVDFLEALMPQFYVHNIVNSMQ